MLLWDGWFSLVCVAAVPQGATLCWERKLGGQKPGGRADKRRPMTCGRRLEQGGFFVGRNNKEKKAMVLLPVSP